MTEPTSPGPSSETKPNSAPLNPAVFYTSVIVLALVLGGAALAPKEAGDLFAGMQDAIVTYGSWYYVLAVAIILVSVVVVAVTRFGDIKLGPDHAQPEYSLVSWFAMLFAAGMGIGLMFFGVAEPVNHFLSPPLGEGGTAAAAKEAMNITFFHWGLHAWATYAIVAVILAYFSFRHDLPLTLRSALYPLIGERIYGPIGTAVDVFAIISTTFGVATSLGFGVEQINSGLNYLFDVPKSVGVQLGLVLLTTALATISVVLGLDAGIKRLSEINIVLAVLLLVGVLAFGPTVYLLQMFMQNTGGYLADIVGKTFNLYAYRPTDWLGGWTIFYWGWWISWAPFVGLFIARISRGRTLREFVFGALAAPTLFTLLWMTVFGNSAISLILDQGLVQLGEAVQLDASVALFEFLGTFSGSTALSMLAIVMVFVFFVTSADSGAMILNMLSSNGRDDTPLLRRVFWMAMIGASALLLLVAGGLPALQAAAIASALPFSLVILVAIWGFVRALAVDDTKRQTIASTPIGPSASVSSSDWKQRLGNLVEHPGAEEVRDFLRDTVTPATQQFADELRALGFRVELETQANQVTLSVLHGDEVDFLYSVVNRRADRPEGVTGSETDSDSPFYHRADVSLREGSQDYCVMGWTESQVIHDLLRQYEAHRHFLHIVR